MLGAILLAIAPNPARAQAVLGFVLEADTNEPIPQVFVSLLAADGSRLDAQLTGRDGRFSFSLQGPGPWSVRAERIGMQTAGSGPFSVADRPVLRLDLHLSAAPILLEGLEIETEARCDLRVAVAGVDRTAALWDEARKALVIAGWAEESRRLSYSSRTFVRERELNGEVTHQQSSRRRAVGAHPFRSPPVDTLSAYGYVRTRDGETEWYGPDLAVLLADTFLRDHCFRPTLVEGRIGLAFEPVRDRELPDIRGTLWFEEATARLDSVSFEYVGVRGLRPGDGTGGSVGFAQLPNGLWYVDRWALRLPRFGIDTGTGERRPLSIRETGGDVSDVSVAPVAIRFPEGSIGAVAGRVLDLPAPEGTVVRLEPGGIIAYLDIEGAFAIPAVPSGGYTLTVEHALTLTDPFGGFVEAPIEVPAADTVRIEASAPSASQVADRTCGAPPDPGLAVLIGTVRDASTGDLVRGGRILALPITGTREELGQVGVVQSAAGYESEITAEGAFVLCGLLPDYPIRVEVEGSAGGIDGFEVQAVESGAVRIVDWLVAWRKPDGP